MRQFTRPAVILLATTLVISTPSQAGLTDLLKNLEEGSKRILQDPSDGGTTAAVLSNDTLIQGLKEALEVGSRRAIDAISQEGGYLNNPAIRIPLPPTVGQVADTLRRFGLGDQVDQFETSMNRAAEQAAPHATDLIIGALREMTIEDAQRIYNGPDDAATQYFREKTYDRLAGLFRPSVRDAMDQVGVTRNYSVLARQAQQIPFVGEQFDLDLDNYVTAEALNGLFGVLAVEEKKIRENPVARTTELLKQLFGQ